MPRFATYTFWHYPGSTVLQSRCLKWAISPSSHRSIRMAPQHTTIQTQTTCPMTILILLEPTHWQSNPLKPLIPFPFHLQINHLYSLRLRLPQKQAQPLPKALSHLLAPDHHSFLPLVFQLPTMTPTMCHPSPLLNTLPSPHGLRAAKETHTHMCDLFCDADAVGLSSARLSPIT